ncbi:hypothetical protein ACUXAV_006130 [Cupriavidus metallidurans]|uniref:hypothetical protein n=1 Tax=Cupriavidus metallidurans TaxID=119219 RepID=UPI000AF7DD50|nr:hypothetical protein [Cupriavidus metallidurans]MDE4920189.1 hypothetical protein [Cupriavidus metallidurans]
METAETRRAVFLKSLGWHQDGWISFEMGGKYYQWDGRLACRVGLEELGGLMGEW